MTRNDLQRLVAEIPQRQSEVDDVDLALPASIGYPLTSPPWSPTRPRRIPRRSSTGTRGKMSGSCEGLSDVIARVASQWRDRPLSDRRR
jgi:hypothetical protein